MTRVCPVCGTEVTMLRGRSGRRLVWCWKCEGYLKAGVDPDVRADLIAKNEAREETKR